MKNKMNKLMKTLTVAGLVVMVTGCASVGSASKGTISNKKNGVIYGYATTSIKTTVGELCSASGNADERCFDKEKYQAVAIMSSHGFSDGGYGIMALANKDMKIDFGGFQPKFKDYTYYKVKVDAGKFGTVIEVASSPKEGKCDWVGLNAAGGTVCPAYNWDYRKDNGAAVEY